MADSHDSPEIPSQLQALRALIEQSSLRHSIDRGVLDVLDDLSRRVYACEQNIKLNKASYVRLDKSIGACRMTIARTLETISEIRRQLSNRVPRQ